MMNLGTTWYVISDEKRNNPAVEFRSSGQNEVFKCVEPSPEISGICGEIYK